MELFKLTLSEVQTLKDETLANLIKFNSQLKSNYSTVKENVRKCKEVQQKQTEKLVTQIKTTEINYKRLDEKIDLEAEKFYKKLIENDSQFKMLQSKLNKPMKENLSINVKDSQQEVIKMHKSMLQKIEQGKINPQQLLHSNTHNLNNKAKTITQNHYSTQQTKESQTLDIIRKMKREKAWKILKAFRRYKFAKNLKRYMAVKKIQKWYRIVNQSGKIIRIQKYLRGYISRKEVQDNKEERIKEIQAIQFQEKYLKWKIISAFYNHVREQENRKKSSRLYPILKKYNSVSKVHLGMLERIDFWEIFPREGKYAMAVEFHKKRMLAVVLSRWMLSTHDII
eukprot:403337204